MMTGRKVSALLRIMWTIIIPVFVIVSQTIWTLLQETVSTRFVTRYDQDPDKRVVMKNKKVTIIKKK